jgi:hypothetical protein
MTSPTSFKNMVWNENYQFFHSKSDPKDRFYVVEKIVGCREIKKASNEASHNTKKYCVKWQGYSDLTWENEENLEYAREEIVAFHKRQRMRAIRQSNKLLKEEVNKVIKEEKLLHRPKYLVEFPKFKSLQEAQQAMSSPTTTDSDSDCSYLDLLVDANCVQALTLLTTHRNITLRYSPY